MKARSLFWVAAGALWCASLLYVYTYAGAQEAQPQRSKLDAAVVKKVEWEVRTLAKKLSETGKADQDTVFAMLANFLWKNPEIHGAAYAVAPTMKNGKEVKACPYVYRSGDQLVQKDLSTRYDYAAPEQKWYAKAARLGKAVWSQPTLEQSGNGTWMTAYSVPVYAGTKEHQLIGVVTGEVPLPVE